jgi:hypothetical protein
MAVTSKRAVDAERFKAKVKEFWDITDHGPIKWFLGFQIKRDRESRTISINQQAYIESTVQQCPPMLKQAARMNGVPYSEAIGLVLWATVVSRPDTVFTVGVLSQFIQNPGPQHWEGVKRLIRYLGSTKEMWLTFGGSTQVLLEGYCDADWGSQPHRHSISGFSFHYGQGAISWSSKKQNIIALLSTEAEYIAETHAAKEAIWLQTFINEVVGTDKNPLTMMADNQGAIALAKDNKFHSRTKHIDLHYHFVHEAVEKGKITVQYIPTSENVADIFTKALPKLKFTKFVGKLGLAMMKE